MRLRFTTGDGKQPREVEIGGGMALTGAAERAGLALNTRCGCKGVCAGCAVRLVEGEFETGGERIVADPAHEREVLACRTLLAGQTGTVHVPAVSLIEHQGQIDADFVLSRPLRFAPGARRVAVTVPAATLESPSADWDRLVAALPGEWAVSRTPPAPELLNRLGAVLEAAEGRVVATLSGRAGAWCVLDVAPGGRPGDAAGACFGLAADIGTTTVAMLLVDLTDGTILSRAAGYNRQIARADDVAARISYADAPERLAELQRLIIGETINPLAGELCREHGIEADQIVRLAVSGNTVMTHLALGLSPASIGRLPFQPVTNRYPVCRGAELGVTIHPRARVEFAPSVAGYIGGDVVSDMETTGLAGRAAPTLLVDIGTNGEMVLAVEGRLVACATAAGPAFEGGGVRHGVRAAEGAIEHIGIGGGLVMELSVIGGGRPTGLCGTAMIDFIAEGMRCGLINAMGRFDLEMLRRAGRYTRREAKAGPIHACMISEAGDSAGGREIYISEYDISQILKAKAAIYAGMKTLLQRAGLDFGQLDRLVLAGGFARHLWLRNAVAIGLLPHIEYERFEIVGNGSLAGAYLMLTETETMGRLEQTAELPEVVELNLDPRFEANFIDALALPILVASDFTPDKGD